MTISSTTNRLVFAGPGNGFAYNKPVFAQSGSDLYVLIEQADGTLLEPTLGGAGTYDFTISGSYDAASFRYPAGVTVTLNNALPSGWTIAIECRPPNTQSSDYTDGGPLPAERLETDLDRLTVMMQTVQGQAGDAVRISPTASGFSNDPIVPIADRVLAFDSAGTAFALLAPNASAYIALPIGIAEGGTGATTKLGAQQALDLEPGVDVQAYDAALASLAGLSLAAGDVLYATGADTLARLPVGTAGQTLTVNSGATAPEWATTSAGVVRQVVTITVAAASTTADIPDDNTSPTSAEGTEICSGSITLGNASNKVLIQSGFFLGMLSGNRAVATLFRSTTALATAIMRPGSDGGGSCNFNYMDTPGSTGPHTYSIRVGRGTAGGTVYVNQEISGAKYNGLMAGPGVTLTELTP